MGKKQGFTEPLTFLNCFTEKLPLYTENIWAHNRLKILLLHVSFE